MMELSLSYKEITQRTEMRIRRLMASGDRNQRQYAYGVYLGWRSVVASHGREDDVMRMEKLVNGT